MTTNETMQEQANQSTDYRPSDRWAPAQAVPNVGDLVVYHPRPGEGRSGRLKFPGLVLQADEGNGHCMLLVFFEADDVRSLALVPPRSEQNPRGWEWPASGKRSITVEPEPQKALLDRLSRSENEVANIVKQIWGAGLTTLERPLMDVFGEFYRSMLSLKGQVETLQQQLGMIDGVATVPGDKITATNQPRAKAAKPTKAKTPKRK